MSGSPSDYSDSIYDFSNIQDELSSPSRPPSPDTAALLGPVGCLTPAYVLKTKDGKPRIMDLNNLGLVAGTPQKQTAVEEKKEYRAKWKDYLLPIDGQMDTMKEYARKNREARLKVSHSTQPQKVNWKEEQREKINNATNRIHQSYVNDIRVQIAPSDKHQNIQTRYAASMPRPIEPVLPKQTIDWEKDQRMRSRRAAERIQQAYVDELRRTNTPIISNQSNYTSNATELQLEEIRNRLELERKLEEAEQIRRELFIMRQETLKPIEEVTNITEQLHFPEPTRPKTRVEETIPKITNVVEQLHFPAATRPKARIEETIPKITDVTEQLHFPAATRPKARIEDTIPKRLPDKLDDRKSEVEIDEMRTKLLEQKRAKKKKKSKTRKKSKKENDGSTEQAGNQQFFPRCPARPQEDNANGGESYSKRKRRLKMKESDNIDSNTASNAHEQVEIDNRAIKVNQDIGCNEPRLADDKTNQDALLVKQNTRLHKTIKADNKDVNGTRFNVPAIANASIRTTDTNHDQDANVSLPLIPRQMSQRAMCWNSETAKRGLGFKSKQRRAAEEEARLAAAAAVTEKQKVVLSSEDRQKWKRSTFY